MCGAIVEEILQPTAAQDPGFLGQIADSTTVGPKQKCTHLHHFCFDLDGIRFGSLVG